MNRPDCWAAAVMDGTRKYKKAARHAAGRTVEVQCCRCTWGCVNLIAGVWPRGSNVPGSKLSK
ncbi:hypothetical protein BIFGAL_04451 [Bifidobacterium gallicum DSM 20093 = LMG 11596]|uniref:Uncharacterized protein n=1 Tax=Bifidobacterium gallicum DSM 20093 = LMG 11596 TaxID=561180 RepID=D1NX43_9BIFI|nr:hypothetical protein BIFGAL_04451 [Bifidobacterium gallicum DSM 20093 = LMG 11596]